MGKCGTNYLSLNQYPFKPCLYPFHTESGAWLDLSRRVLTEHGQGLRVHRQEPPPSTPIKGSNHFLDAFLLRAT